MYEDRAQQYDPEIHVSHMIVMMIYPSSRHITYSHVQTKALCYEHN